MSLCKAPTKPRGFPKGKSGNPKGRGKGVKDRRTLAREAGIDTSGLTPLEFMLQVLRNPKSYNKEDRKWAADKAAPYIHRKMPIALEGGDPRKPITIVNADKLKDLSTTELESLVNMLTALGAVVDAESAEQE